MVSKGNAHYSALVSCQDDDMSTISKPRLSYNGCAGKFSEPVVSQQRKRTAL
jgi:hypothetical protein